LAWVDRSGKILNTVGPMLPGLAQPRLSPDEHRAVAVSGESWPEQHIWLFDLVNGSAAPFARNPAQEFYPNWGQEGRTIAFTRSADGKSWMVSASTDGSGREERLFEGTGRVSESGRFLFVTQTSRSGNVTRGHISTADAAQKFVPWPEAYQGARTE